MLSTYVFGPDRNKFQASAKFQRRVSTVLSVLQRLFHMGLRFGTVIDVGCADGNLFLELLTRGMVPGATSLNIDANSLYEESLREIATVVGGQYWIGAVTDHEGEVELTTSVHPYWASLRP